MRACMIAYTFYEGDNRVRRYAETLIKAGYEVDAIVLRQENSKSLVNVAGVKVYKIQKRIINEKKETDYLLKLLIFLFKSFLTVTLNHFRKKYDLIHVHSIPDFEVFAAIVPRFTGAKVILDIHDIVPELFISKFNKTHQSKLFKFLILIEKLSAYFSNHVIVANHIWHKRLISRSIPEKKCSVIMNYPDPSIFYPRLKNRIDNNFLMIYPGTLSHHQGLETAIRAVYLLQEKIPSLQFHIYGKGTEENYFLTLVKELELQERVKFFNIVPIEELPQIISNADIGVEPKLKRSFGNEAFSTKILEFLMMGIPVIASDTLVHKHYFTDDVVMFFESENISDLANAIYKMFTDVELRIAYKQNAMLFMKDYSWENRKHEYMKIADTIIAS